MQPGINQRACGEERTRSTLDWDSQAAAAAVAAGAMLRWKFPALLFWKAALENVSPIKNRRDDASDMRGCHTCVNAKTWKRRRSCAIIFVYLANLGREIQLLPWKVGRSSVEKSTLAQCCSGLWGKLHRCRFQSERRQSRGSYRRNGICRAS